MNETQLLVFALSGQRCALSLSVVETVVRAVEISPLAKAPEIIMGVINVRGRAMPVLNIRKLFRLPESAMTLNDQMIIVHTANRPLAILVDNVVGVAEHGQEDVVRSDELYPGIEYLKGVVKLQDGMAYIYDLDRFLSLEESKVIDRLLAARSPDI